jgi:hypothetical protein
MVLYEYIVIVAKIYFEVECVQCNVRTNKLLIFVFAILNFIYMSRPVYICKVLLLSVLVISSEP